MKEKIQNLITEYKAKLQGKLTKPESEMLANVIEDLENILKYE